MTNAEARFNKSLRPRKPEGSLGRTAQDVHLDSHTAPELCIGSDGQKSTSPIGLTGIPMVSLSSHETGLFLLSSLSLCPPSLTFFSKYSRKKSVCTDRR